MSKNTATVFLIDISSSTGEDVQVTDLQHPGQTRKTTALALELEYVKEKLGEKLWRGLKTDRAAVFTFGSEKTNNTLAGVQEGYEGIDEIAAMGPATTAHYDKLRRLKPSSLDGDALSAVVVGITEVDKEVGSKKNWTKEIILVTDGRSPINWDGAEQIRDKLNESKIELTVVGVNFDDEALEYVEEDKPEDKRVNETMWSNMLDGLRQASAFGNAVHALNYVRAPRPQKTNGTASKTTLTLGNFQDHPETSISIDVEVYKAIQMERPKSQKRMSTISGKTNRQVIDPARGKKRKRTDELAEREHSIPAWNASVGASQAFALSQTQAALENGNGGVDARDDRERDRSLTFGVNTERKYFYVPAKEAVTPLEGDFQAGGIRSAAQAREEERARDDSSNDSDGESEEKPREEVASDVELVKAYRYGATRVPMSGVDESMLILDAKPGIEILGFSARSDIRREYHLGLAWWVFGQPASGEGQISMSILAHALYEKDFVAVARFVAGTRNAAPRMVALYPRLQPEDDMEAGRDRWEGLIMLQLSFADDVRSYTFNSLKRLVSKTGKEITEHRFLPTENMNDAMSNYVDSMHLDRAAGDADGSSEPWYRTISVCNPAVHAVKRAVLYRTANPLDPDLPPLHSEITKYFRPPEKVVENSKDALQEVVESFEIRRVPPKPKKRKAGTSTTVAPAEELEAAAQYDALLAGIDDTGPGSFQGVTSDRGDAENKTSIKQNNDGTDVELSSDTTLVGLKAPRFLVGLDDPVGDFERVLSTREEMQVDAIKELTSVAHELFKNTVGSSAFSLVLECLRRARRLSVDVEAIVEWNDFIAQFKNVVLSRPHKSFWKQIQHENLGLISVVESGEDPLRGDAEAVSVEVAEKFLM